MIKASSLAVELSWDHYKIFIFFPPSFSAQIFFDDAFQAHSFEETNYQVNDFVKQLVRLIDVAARYCKIKGPAYHEKKLCVLTYFFPRAYFLSDLEE